MESDMPESGEALRDAILQELHFCQLCKAPVPNGTEIDLHISPISQSEFERSVRGKSLSKKSRPLED